MKKEDKSNLVNEAEEEHNENNENGFVGERETAAKSTTVRLCGNWKLEGLTLVILVVVIFSLAVTVAMVIHILVGPPQVVPHGAAASMSPLCSKAAVDVMHVEKGNAIDGAVAAAFCESVTLAHRTGFGGGALIFTYSQTGRNATLFDCREAAPSKSSDDMFKGKNAEATSGGLSVAVPGFLRCLRASHKQFGKTPWEKLLKPAIKIAKDGFPMSKELHQLLKSDASLLNKVKSSDVLASMYLTGNKSEPLAQGTIIKRVGYAKLLEKLATDGDTLLYDGDVAKEIIDVVTAKGGIMTSADLKSYKAKKPLAIRGHFNHFTVLSFPLPSIGGPLLLGTLNALDAYGIYKSPLPNQKTKKKEITEPDALYYHRLVEIMRLNLNEVESIGAGSNESVVSSFISVETAKKIIGNIHSNRSATLTWNAATPLTELPSGESHLAIEGPDNTIVGISSSLGGIFGSGVVTPSQIILNNAMGAFSLPDVEPVNSQNLPGPNKRPLTPLSPFIAHNPRRRCGVRFGAGSSDGISAPQASAQVAISALRWDVPKCQEKDCLDLKTAVKKPRLAVKVNSNTVEVESGIPQKAIDLMKSNGKTVKVVKSIGDVQAAGEVQHVVTAYSDRRHGGKEDSY